MPLAFPSWEGLGVGSSCLLPLAFPYWKMFTTQIEMLYLLSRISTDAGLTHRLHG
ncbi:hypothetical protein [Moorena producens]|uniref:hypothetical protein n=1 Tax=Moorena producens TaxID=1155739 RepID=UPI003C7745DF